jgi:hypothetical protein
LVLSYLLFGSDGKQWEGTTSAVKVLINPPADVDDLRKAVKAKYNEPNYLQNIPSCLLFGFVSLTRLEIK